jgi:mycothiol S-conjugate amidase
VEITRVQCADYFPIRDQALLAATQIDPESSWFACPVEVQRAAWSTEDYHLARSVVDTEFPEDDLSTGCGEGEPVSVLASRAPPARCTPG